MNNPGIAGHAIRSITSGVIAAIIYIIILLATGGHFNQSAIVTALLIGIITFIVAFIISYIIGYFAVANRRS
jgi:ABC-type uncharacterized transport system permease subunit